MPRIKMQPTKVLSLHGGHSHRHNAGAPIGKNPDKSSPAMYLEVLYFEISPFI